MTFHKSFPGPVRRGKMNILAIFVRSTTAPSDCMGTGPISTGRTCAGVSKSLLPIPPAFSSDRKQAVIGLEGWNLARMDTGRLSYSARFIWQIFDETNLMTGTARDITVHRKGATGLISDGCRKVRRFVDRTSQECTRSAPVRFVAGRLAISLFQFLACITGRRWPEICDYKPRRGENRKELV